MNQGQIKTKKQSGIKDIFSIGLPQENFQDSKEPNGLEVMRLLCCGSNCDPFGNPVVQEWYPFDELSLQLI